MAHSKPVTLELPPFPTLTRGEHHWEGRVSLPAWSGFQSRQGGYAARNSKRKANGTASISISISVEDDDPTRYTPTPEQGAAFQLLLEHQAAIRDAILRKVFRSYPARRREYAGDYDIEDPRELEKVLPFLSAPSGLKRVIGLSEVHLSTVSHAEVAYLGMEFGCNWEEEHGLGVLLHKKRIVTIDHADVCFLEWVAEEDVEKQTKKRR